MRCSIHCSVACKRMELLRYMRSPCIASVYTGNHWHTSDMSNTDVPPWKCQGLVRGLVSPFHLFLCEDWSVFATRAPRIPFATPKHARLGSVSGGLKKHQLRFRNISSSKQAKKNTNHKLATAMGCRSAAGRCTTNGWCWVCACIVLNIQLCETMQWHEV